MILLKKGFSIYYSLSSVEEMPDVLEEYLNHWMSISKEIIEDTGSTKAHLKLKSEVIDLISLYTVRFSTDFRTYSYPFFDIIWKSTISFD